jgi:crotonobetainyl-CoA:carnitine CoA-transferase CaiB-like acyl-CoA transferase
LALEIYLDRTVSAALTNRDAGERVVERRRLVAGPLAGIRVLDLSRLLPGPYCSLMLGDLGAEVLKIEDPEQGDYTRWWGPRIHRQGAFFLMVNRNKKSMKLNLKTDMGKEIFLRLVRQHDVLLEGFRPGVMERLGLGFETLREENPGLIYCAITGYGYTGPYRERAGHDLNYLSLAGVLSTIGPKGGPPVIPGVQIADLGGGAMTAALGILAAYIARQKTGKGQFIDIAMLDGSFSWLPVPLAKTLADGEDLVPGNSFLTGGYACYRVYETKEGCYMGLAALEPQFWKNFCETVGRRDLIACQFSEGERQTQLIAEVSEIFKGKTKAQWVELLETADCCCEPVNSVSEALADPQLLARDMILEVEHPTIGRIKQTGIALKFSETPGEITLAPPGHGEHTIEMLEALGFEGREIKEMEEKGII